MFKVGEVYSRTALHIRFGGQPRKRISTPAEHNMIMLFANHRISQNGSAPYTSGWTRYGVFRFIGEGRYGHMVFARGNRALRNHSQIGKPVYLFVRTDAANPDSVCYEGEFIYRGHFYKEGYDERSHIRRMIVFVLKPNHLPQAEQQTTRNTRLANK